jgi:hypothetical protein
VNSEVGFSDESKPHPRPGAWANVRLTKAASEFSMEQPTNANTQRFYEVSLFDPLLAAVLS